MSETACLQTVSWCHTVMDKYVKIKKIGEGAFGVAYLARHKDLKDRGKQVVLKEINMTRVSCCTEIVLVCTAQVLNIHCALFNFVARSSIMFYC